MPYLPEPQMKNQAFYDEPWAAAIGRRLRRLSWYWPPLPECI